MQKVFFGLLIALSCIGYSRAQLLLQPSEEVLRPRPIPSAQNINVAQLIGEKWRRVKPYNGDIERLWQFTHDTLTIHEYCYETKEWESWKYPYYLSSDDFYTYDEKEFDNSKVGNTPTGICIVYKLPKFTRPEYYRIIKLDKAEGIMELFRKGRWDEIGGGDCYLKLQIMK